MMKININLYTIPIRNYDTIKNPNVEDFVNLNEILNIIQTLKCNMYENSILPIALINKEISLKRFFKSILN
ncbi:hypothetical protein [Lebetimonas sp. JH292]|uniref:hypothetical protein n=1 Tax=Lebetimonas sp. JH292 TaxID=990068 RepID=UPI001F1CBC0A|nr:hypothetical protein [Lebetimonas sp. JH292]